MKLFKRVKQASSATLCMVQPPIKKSVYIHLASQHCYNRLKKFAAIYYCKVILVGTFTAVIFSLMSSPCYSPLSRVSSKDY